jgi:hypothetical protein
MEHEGYEFQEEFAQDTIEVKLIRRSGGAALVEWQSEDGYLQRATVPFHEVQNLWEDRGSNLHGEVAQEIIEIGIPYGVPWEDIIGEIQITAKDIAESLRKHGVWTLDDAQTNPQTVIGALQAAYGFDMATLIRGARKMKEEAQ